MEKLISVYPFTKFWECFERQDRGVSKWDDKRTDQDVFIRRTLSRWFEGKIFQVVFDKYIPSVNLCLDSRPAYRIKYTKYILITHIHFTFAPYHDQVTFYYAEPHSNKIERMDIKRGDWHDLSIEEDKESWTILRRFYPFEKSEIKTPTI